MKTIQRLLNLLGCACVVCLMSVSSRVASQDSAEQPHRVVTSKLRNVIQVNADILSGALPEGPDAFAELRKLGIKTVLSVDGMTPEVELAKENGLRYVHLPIGYDGISKERQFEIAKALKELPRPIYVHCHHGKHRSPAATASGCYSIGAVTREQANKVLELAGTNKGFQGLYDAVAKARLITYDEFAQAQVEFLEISPVPVIAEAMTGMDEVFEHLKEANEAKWPRDKKIANDALLLLEHFVELERLEAVQSRPAKFRESLAEGERHARELEKLLRGGDLGVEARSKHLTASFLSIETNCKSCHRQFRDVPQGNNP